MATKMEAERQLTGAFGVRCANQRKEGFSHLRSLSSYSRKIVCDNADGGPGLGQNLLPPFCNIKIEIVNSQARVSGKRSLDSVSGGEGCSTPPRKRLALDSSSPGLESGTLDTCGDILGRNQAPRSPDKAQIGKGGGGVTSHGEFGSGGVAHTPLPGPETLPPLGTSVGQICQTKGEVDVDHASDFGIDIILSLSPMPLAGHAHSPPVSHAQSTLIGHDRRPLAVHSYSPVSPVPWLGTDGEVGVATQKEEASLDEGYFSQSYSESVRGRAGRIEQHSEVSPLVLGAELLSSRREQELLDEGGALPSPTPCRNLLPFLDDTPQPLASGAGVQGLEGAEEEAGFRAGSPVCKSSLPQGSFWEGDREPAGAGMTVKVEADKRTCPSPCKSTVSLGGKGEPLKKPLCGTAPAPVKVRSVVVIPQRRVDQNDAKSRAKHIDRPLVYERLADWLREKELYMAAVSSHMASNAPVGRGVLTELDNLMKTVAMQRTGNDSQPWQHPSDLTRRNYKSRLGKDTVSLDKWQQWNRKSYRRFASVPATFQRSPIP